MVQAMVSLEGLLKRQEAAGGGSSFGGLPAIRAALGVSCGRAELERLLALVLEQGTEEPGELGVDYGCKRPRGGRASGPLWLLEISSRWLRSGRSALIQVRRLPSGAEPVHVVVEFDRHLTDAFAGLAVVSPAGSPTEDLRAYDVTYVGIGVEPCGLAEAIAAATAG